MPFERATDLEILQERVSSTEILLRFICQELTEEQKAHINSKLEKHLEKWNEIDLLKKIVKGSQDLLNKDI